MILTCLEGEEKENSRCLNLETLTLDQGLKGMDSEFCFSICIRIIYEKNPQKNPQQNTICMDLHTSNPVLRNSDYRNRMLLVNPYSVKH